MKKNKYPFFLIFLVWFFPSCVVTNSLYVNDPTPLGKNNGFGYIGGGTGIKPKIDSITNNTTINFSNKIAAAPILSLGGQIGLGDHMNLKGAIHFPQIIGGIGLRAGTQYGFFEKKSKFNIALGIDLAGVWGRDSVKFFGIYFQTPHEVETAFNADFSLPVSYKIKENFSVILTSRYCFYSFDIRRELNNTMSRQFAFQVPVLSLGVRIHNFYIETTAIYYDNNFFPHFGVAYIFPKDLTEKSKNK